MCRTRICRSEDISLEQITILRHTEVNYIEKNKGMKPYTQIFNKEKKCRLCGKIPNFKKVLAYGKICSKCGKKIILKSCVSLN